jgi:hypothetical protein
MKTELVLFGQHINMAPRTNRRLLVVVFYGVFGAILIASWMKGPHAGAGFWAGEFALFVGPILGGYFSGVGTLTGRRGLVEPFKAGVILKYPDSASVLKPSTLLHPVVDNDPELRIDERALRRRDYAHYVSHGFLGGLISVGFILEFLSYSNVFSYSNQGGGIESLHLTSGDVNRIVYYLLQIGYICALTLPQAVLLWTEPDMEAEG